MAHEPQHDLLEEKVLTVRYEYDSIAKSEATMERQGDMLAAGWEQYMEAKSRSTGVVYLRYRRVQK